MKAEDKKIVRIFAAASFLHDVGSDMVFSVWPLFVTETLGANIAILGFIDGLGDAIVSISQAVSGYLSDRLRKRKIFIWSGYLMGGISRIGYALSPTWQWLIPFRLLDRSGKIRGAPRDAMISDVSSIKDRGRNFGILRMMDNFGAVIGIIISFLFINSLGVKKFFFLAAIPSMIAVLLVAFFIKERKMTDKRLYKGIRFKDLNNNLKLFTILNSFFALGSFSYSFLLLYAKEYGFSDTSIPLLYLLFTVFAAISSLPFGKLSDRIGRKKVLYISFLFWAFVLYIFLFSHFVNGIIIAFIFYGLHKGALEPVQKTFVAELAPKEYTASVLGGFQMVIGLVSLPASVFAGILWQQFGISSPLYLSLFLTILSSFCLLFVKENMYN